MFGYAYWVPGTVQLAVFVVLFAIGAVLVVMRVGWSAGSLFFAALTFLLTFASIQNWYFGALLGEPIAFAFIFLGLALLSCRQGRWSILFAGVCFSFALLAKQIALFSIIGVVGAWLVLRYADRRGRFELINDLAVLALGVFSAAISFEVFKIFKLGVGLTHLAIDAVLVIWS